METEMEDSGIQTRTHIANGNRDNSAQGDQEDLSWNPVTVNRVQNGRIPAHNGADPGSNLIPISTVAGAVATHTGTSSSGGRNSQPARAPSRRRSNSQLARAPSRGRTYSQSAGAASRSRTYSLSARAASQIYSGGRNPEPVRAPRQVLSDGRGVFIVEKKRDDGDISMELSNAVAAEDDVPVGHIKVRVTVRNTCPITCCGCVDYINFITIVSLEDAPTRLMAAKIACFRCYRPGCDLTFELVEHLSNPFNYSSRFPCPECTSPLGTKFLFSSEYRKRFTSRVCGGDHDGLTLFP